MLFIIMHFFNNRKEDFKTEDDAIQEGACTRSSTQQASRNSHLKHKDVHVLFGAEIKNHKTRQSCRECQGTLGVSVVGWRPIVGDSETGA